MANKVNELPLPLPKESPTRDEPSDHGKNPEIHTRSPLEKEFNVMTQGDLDHLRERYSFSFRIQARIPEDDETILSTRPGEVAFMKLYYLPT